MKILFKYLFIILVILLVKLNAYSQNNNFVINKINISGNTKTKNSIILREVELKQGDTVNTENLNNKIETTKNNLQNTLLFNKINISTKIIENKINININVEERWYFWPYPIFEQADRNLSSFLYNKDFSKINYGAYFIKYNFRGQREILKIKIRLGYKEQYSLIYSIPFIDKNKKNGLDFETYYFRQHEIYYNTINNKLAYYRLNNKFFSKNFYQTITYSYRPKYKSTFTAQLSYNNINIDTNILNLNKNYLLYNQTYMQDILGKINFTIDNRDYKIYPLKGYYYNFSINDKLILNQTNLSFLSIYQELKYFAKLPKHFYFQSSLAAKKTFSENIPYYFYDALGYENYLRGFELFVIDGSSYYLTHTNLKFEIIPTKEKTINLIPFEKFKHTHYSIYTNLFFDTGYVKNLKSMSNNSMQNNFLYSYGLGFDFVTYYDKVLRIEYSINNFGNKGIYLHISTSI